MLVVWLMPCEWSCHVNTPSYYGHFLVYYFLTKNNNGRLSLYFSFNATKKKCRKNVNTVLGLH